MRNVETYKGYSQDGKGVDILPTRPEDPGAPYRPGSVILRVATAEPNYVAVVPVNAKRFSLLFTANNSGFNRARPVGYGYTQSTTSFVISANGGVLYLDATMVGDLITQAWEVTSSGNLEVMVIETNRH